MLDSTRLYHPMKIAGEDVRAESTIDVRNPFTGQVIAAVPQARPEHVRRALRAIGRITGRVDLDELLDVVFRDFCIGK